MKLLNLSQTSTKVTENHSFILFDIKHTFRRRKNGRKNRKNRKRGNANSGLFDEFGGERNEINNYDKDDSSSSSFHRDTSYINSGIFYIQSTR